MKIRILSQNPLSVWFGGVEVQANKYITLTKNILPDADIDWFRWDETQFDILHLVGIHTGTSPYWIDVLQKKWVKIVVSSVFYVQPENILDFRRPFFYKAASCIPFHITSWMKQVVCKADVILPNSCAEGRQLESIFGAKKEKIRVLPNGVDANFFQGIHKDLFKEKFWLEQYLLSVSHIEPRKNQEKLIQSFLELKKTSPNFTHIKLVLLGDYRGNYFTYHKQIKTLIDNNSQSILHLNNLSNTDELFRSAYLWAETHVLPSILETPGLSNIEAGLAWCKLVVGDCDPVREYFGKEAIYVDPHSQKDIAAGIKKAFQNKIDTTSQAQILAINYSWETICQQLAEIYKSL